MNKIRLHRYAGAEPENFQGMKLGHFDKYLKNPKKKAPTWGNF